jgi:hypothetical protein
MIFGETPSFDTVLATIDALEQTINVAPVQEGKLA